MQIFWYKEYKTIIVIFVLGQKAWTKQPSYEVIVTSFCVCRFLGKDIITIREAAWLTDNTYKYEDVVRMMGEITATLKGKFRVSAFLHSSEFLSL